MELLLGFGAGVLTLINPCVLPVLPVILITALNQHRLGPLALCGGLTVTFVVIGMFVASIGPAFGIDSETVAAAAALAMIVFGAVLLLPALGERFALATSGASNSLAGKTQFVPNQGLSGQFLTGAILGAVWSPCIGPTLGGAIALASEGNNIPWAAAIMFSFALGVSGMILFLSILSRSALTRQQARFQTIAPYVRPITGAILLTLGIAMWFQLHHVAEFWLLENMPGWLLELSVSI